jgi:hypothetical protein
MMRPNLSGTELESAFGDMREDARSLPPGLSFLTTCVSRKSVVHHVVLIIYEAGWVSTDTRLILTRGVVAIVTVRVVAI